MLTVLNYAGCTTAEIRRVVRNAERHAEQSHSPYHDKAMILLPALRALLADREERDRLARC